MNCTDCLKDGKNPTLIFEAKQMGHVCPRCERVYSMFVNNPGNFHYVTKEAAMRKIARDQKERAALANTTQAMVERILKPID